MVFNDNFSNISNRYWPTVVLVEETRVPGENHHPDMVLHMNWDYVSSKKKTKRIKKKPNKNEKKKTIK
jgi:hypothetical protein